MGDITVLLRAPVAKGRYETYVASGTSEPASRPSCATAELPSVLYRIDMKYLLRPTLLRSRYAAPIGTATCYLDRETDRNSHDILLLPLLAHGLRGVCMAGIKSVFWSHVIYYVGGLSYILTFIITVMR